MKSLWSRIRLDRISGQIQALLLVAVIAGTGITATTVVLVLTAQDQPSGAASVPVRVATLVATLENLPRPVRAEVVNSLQDDVMRLALDVDISSPVDDAGARIAILKMLIARSLPASAQLLSVTEDPPGIAVIGVRLGDGQVLSIESRFNAITLLPPLLGPVVLLFISVKLLSVWAAFQIVAPLRRFAAAADQFGTNGQGAALDEHGPVEIRRASQAFNRMRERIGRLIEDRTNLLLAISHDLRTPLTRLRLRLAELVDSDEAMKARALDDITTMEGSITAAVTYLREGAAEEPVERVEIGSMLTTICDQYSDLGFPTEYIGPPKLIISCRPRAIERAVTNLVENATKYAQHADLILAHEDRGISIEVRDDGPGIPDSEKPRVVQPFYRSDPARQDVRGFGLGLAIVSSIAQAEGGELSLLDNSPHGLRARITLPSVCLDL